MRYAEIMSSCLAAVIFLSASSCKTRDFHEGAQPEIYGNDVGIYNVQIKDAEVIIKNPDRDELDYVTGRYSESERKQFLQYPARTQLDFIKMNLAKDKASSTVKSVEIKQYAKRNDGSIWIKYDGEVQVVTSASSASTGESTYYLPAYSDDSSLKALFREFYQKCEVHGVNWEEDSASHMYYHMNISKEGCDWKAKARAGHAGLKVIPFTQRVITNAAGRLQTPEYKKIFGDGLYAATMLIAATGNEPGPLTYDDAGVQWH